MAAATPLRWLLDTSIVAELARPEPAAQVMQAFARHAHEAAIPIFVWHELLYGALRLPEGQRKQALLRFVHTVPGALPKIGYDEPVARCHAELRAAQHSRGQPLAEPDAQLVAQALTHKLTLVTRHARDFPRIDGLQIASWFEA